MAGETTKLVIELEVVLRRLNQTLRGLDQVKRKLESVANVRFNARTTTNAVDRQTLAAQRLALQQQRLQLAQQRLAVQTQELANRQERARQTTDRLARSSNQLEHSLTRQSRAIPGLQQRLNSLGAAALRVGGGLRSVGASAAILVTGPLVALGTIAGKSAADIDAIRNRLIATEGSLEAANKRLEELRRLADSSVGVTRRTALDTFAILATLGDVTEDTINKQIRAFGRLNAAFTIEDQQTFFRNLIQIFQQGFEIRDIREALGRVPIFNILLEEAFGTSNPERLRDLKAAGKLTLDTFLAGIATAVETDPVLGRIQESIRVRFEKTFERLSNALEPLGRAILGPLERIITALEPIILRIAEGFGRLPESVQTAIVALGILTTAAGPLLFVLGGIASGVGAIATAISALIPLAGTLLNPATIAVLLGAVVALEAIIGTIIALAVAWKKNFLNMRQITSDVFKVITTVAGTLAEVFKNFIDLFRALVNSDWRNAWRAFARIVVAALDSIVPTIAAIRRVINRVGEALIAFIATQALKFQLAAQRLAQRFLASLTAELLLGAPRIGNTILLMFLAGIAGLNFTGIAGLLVKNFIAAIRRAAAERGIDEGPQVGVDVGTDPFRRRRRTAATETDTDSKGANRLRRELDRLREAQDRLDEIREEGALEQTRSRIETEFAATKNGLDRELQVLEANFDDRLVALRKYLKDRQELEEARIDREIQKELELSSVLFRELTSRGRAALREFDTELREINEDPKLKGRARDAAIQTAQLKKAAEIEKARIDFAIKHEESQARVIELEKQRKQVSEDILRLDREITRELGIQGDQLRADLLEEQTRTADAASIRLRARFTETLRDLRVDISGLGQDLQTAITNIDLTTLQSRLEELPQPIRTMVELLDIAIKRAQIAELGQFVDDLSSALRLDEQRIQNKVLDGLISQREAQAQIVELQRQYKGQLLDVLKGELKKAELIGDQSLILSLRQQIQETERLGIAIDEVGQRINQALFQDLQSGLAGIFSGARRGFEGLRDAAISFGERLLDTLNDIAATSIVEQLRDVFKPDATNTEGTIGGFISKLFGLAPKVNPATVANTSATVTNTAAILANTAALLGTAATTVASGGLGSFLGSALGAATGMYPSIPGGAVHVLEGGYPEAILTTDPKYFPRQLQILKAYLKETRGLGGRLKAFASGGFISPHEAQSMMLGGLSGGRGVANANIGELAIAGTPSMMRLRQVLVDQRSFRDWVNTPEAETVLVDFLHRHAPIIRNIGGKK